MNQTHNDNPTLNCQLKRNTWRKRIIDQIEKSKAPKVIGVHGTWGMGKTSLLQQIYHHFGGVYFLEGEHAPEKKKEKNNIKVVWFEAWQYQHEPNILAVLLKEIRDQLSIPQRIWKDLEKTAVVGTLSLIQSISATFDNFGAVFGAKSGMSRGFGDRFVENYKEYDREHFATPLDSVMLKKQLQEAIDKLLHLKWTLKKNDNKKLVVFIDDLDRCEPNTAFRILESIKVYLNLNNCVFVLGMDINAMDGIIANHYKGDIEFEEEVDKKKRILKNRARLYLEKICQDIYTLPTPNNKQRTNYLGELIKNEPDIGVDKYKELLKLVEESKLLPPFPRSIKIYANVVISHLADKKIKAFVVQSSENMKAFLIICYLYAFHLDIYNLVYSYETFYNNLFLKYCKSPKEMKDSPTQHPDLKNLVVYLEHADQTVDNLMSGTSETLLEEDLYTRMYPSEHLRQVLWISKLVLDRKEITNMDIKVLQL